MVATALVVMTACSSNGGDPASSPGKGCAAIVQVFLRAGTTVPRERRIGRIIDGAEGVMEWTFHSSREAYREFKKLYEAEPDIYESKEPKDFPARFEVILASDDFYGSFERQLAGATTGVDRLVPGGCVTPGASP